MAYIRTYYGLYFSGSGGVVRLPINPEKLPITWANDNKEYNVLDIGPIMVPRTPALRKVSVSSFFPGREGDTPPETYINFFTSAMANLEVIAFTPVRFYEDGTPFATSDVGFQCLVTEFVYEERGGETGDFYYDLTCTEYRDYTPQRMQIASGSGSGTGASSAAAASAGVLTRARAATPAQSATANGPAYQNSQRGGSYQQLSGHRVIVQRINNTSPSGVFVTEEDGTYIGWIEASALQVVSDTA